MMAEAVKKKTLKEKKISAKDELDELKLELRMLKNNNASFLKEASCASFDEALFELTAHRENVKRLAERFGVNPATPLSLKISMINDAIKKTLKYLE